MLKSSSLTKDLTRKQSLELRDEILWRQFVNISLADAISQFLENFSTHTKRAYGLSFTSFFKLGILHPTMNLQTFSLMNLEGLLDIIKNHIHGTEATKQARCACFISFTSFLCRKTRGMIKKALPSKEKATRTFTKIRNTSVTKALSEKQWRMFIEALKKLNYRDHLIAKAILQGAKRVDEVLKAKISHIDWDNRTITYKQSKSDELYKVTIITYPSSFIEDLKIYIGDRKEGYIFITKSGNKTTQQHIYRSFVSASSRANLPIKITPHVLRATGITMLTNKGFSTEQILKISGHADSRYVIYYDKTPYENNISQEVNLI